MGQNLKPKPKTAAKCPVSDQPPEEFISLVAQILLRIISDPSSKMLLKFFETWQDRRSAGN